MIPSKKFLLQATLASLLLFGATKSQVDSNLTSALNSTDGLALNDTLSAMNDTDAGLGAMNDTQTNSSSPSASDDGETSTDSSNTTKEVSPLADWPEDKCIDNLTNIHDDILLKGEFEMKTYHVCPNTTYQIGTPDSDGSCCDDGQHRPFELRSYTEYICGKDGKSSNNCILTGGQTHIVTTQHGWVGEAAKGIKLRGFTFEKAEMLSALLANQGVIEFIDCIFRDNANIGAIVLVFNPLPFVSSRMLEIDGSAKEFAGFPMNSYTQAFLESSLFTPRSGHMDNGRELDTSATDDVAVKERLQVTFDSCLFFNNTLGPSSPITQNGIILVEEIFHDIIFKKCLFMENNFYAPDEVSEGYALRIQPKNTFVMEDSCFIDNQFFGGGVVALNETVVENVANNYVSSKLPNDLECTFAYEEVEGKCLPPDASACNLLGIPTTSTNQTSNQTKGTKDTTTDGSDVGQSSAFLPRFVSSFVLLLASIVVYL